MSRTSPRGFTARRLGLTLAVIVASWSGVSLLAQIPGRNVNMVAGTTLPDGDPYLQRQNEPSMAASTRNPLHLVAGSNDYRTVDLPGLPDDVETGDAWVSVYKSFDGGERWSSTLMPGYPQDTSPEGMASPLKGYQAAADPVVRAGTNGLVYYNGLVFDRGDNGKSGIFLARFVDQNNKENGDPIAYSGTSMVASSNGTVFLDKPWMAVDLPRNNAPLCVVGGTPTGTRVKRAGHRLRGNSGQTGNSGFVWVDPGLEYVPAGAVYVAYTSITGEDATLRAEILLKRSLDCGATWSAPMRVSRSADAINQGATLSIDPVDGDVFVAYRRFATPQAPSADAVMVARLPVGQMAFGPAGMARALPRTDSPTAALERIFEHRKKRAQGATAPTPVTTTTGHIDQGTSPYSFRTNAYPAMAIDGNSRVYVAWSERGFAAARPLPSDGDARIRVATTLDGTTFSAPMTVEDPKDAGTPLPGHQVMPSLTFAGGKLMLVFYDVRETRANVFGPFVSDQDLTFKRQTIDIRASLGTPGATPVFAPSVRVSDYLFGFRDDGLTNDRQPEQLQFNPPNLPMFKQGTVPFIGDYIDVASSPAFVPTAGGGWAFNTAPGPDLPVFHAVWTDNRDVRPPSVDTNGDGNRWNDYTPPSFATSSSSAQCIPGNAGSRNQNIYTARIGGGLLVGSPGNTKPLSPTVQRGFVVFAQNQTTVTRTFRMSILGQPAGGRASFEQFPRPGDPLPWVAATTQIDVKVPPRSMASRTVYATSTDPDAQIVVAVIEVAAVGGAPVSGGLAGRAVLNPDIENPDIENPDIENPDIENPDIENAEVYNPDIENPDIENPDIENPDIENPDIENPDIENIVVANPDIENVGVTNPDIENPDIENPDIENPDIENPDIENGTFSDVTWTVSNIGNTTSAFNVNVFLAGAVPTPCGLTPTPGCLSTQLIVYKTYKTPVIAPNGCDLRTETRNVVLFNVPNPNFITPGEGLPDQNDPSETNATLWLNPGEVGRVTLRVYDPNKLDNVVVGTRPDGTPITIDPRFNPATVTTVGISGQGVDVLDPPGATEPPAVTTTGTNLLFLQQPTSTLPGVAITPDVRVRVWNNTGAPLTNVLVTVALDNAPSGVVLSGTTTVSSDAAGIATFSGLSVNVAASNLRLKATASASGVVAAGTSAPFSVVPPSTPATVTITNYAALFDGTAKPVTVTTIPPGLATAVTYNASATAPSAIGAYLVQATVTEPGYVGAASVVQTVADTLSAGGSGGGPYPASGALSCGSGVFASGVRASNTARYGLTSGQLICSSGLDPARFIAAFETAVPPSDTAVTCGVGDVMVGLHGTTNAAVGFRVVSRLAPQCQSPSGGPITNAGPNGGAGGAIYPDDPFAITCSSGEAVTGVVGGLGEVVDSVALVCAPLSAVPPTPAITSVSPSAPVATGIGQMLTINGTNLPAGGSASGPFPREIEQQVVFTQAGVNHVADLTWGSSATRWVVRLPTTLTTGPAAVRITNPGATVSTNSFPITVSIAPAAPILIGAYASCSGGAFTPASSGVPGAPVAIEADGIDTFGVTLVWTPVAAVGGSLTQGGLTSTVGPTGRVCAFPAAGAPALTTGTWTLRVRTQGSFSTSADSNGITVVVP